MTPATTPDQPGAVVLSARNVVKTYGGTQALKGVDFDIARGTVTTLFGENGAGKSTLMKILSGVERPTSGDVVLDGEPVVFASTVDARDRGISIIHQELSLAPNLSVRDNIFMGRELRTSRGTVDFAEEIRQTRTILTELEEEIDPLTPVSALRLGQQQIVEIARALSVNARILIMDEPTSALSASEVEILFKVIRDLTSRGVSIVYISHHLEEALRITDHAVVLRDGSITATAPAHEIDLEWVVRQMVGAQPRPLRGRRHQPRRARRGGRLPLRPDGRGPDRAARGDRRTGAGRVRDDPAQGAGRHAPEHRGPDRARSRPGPGGPPA